MNKRNAPKVIGLLVLAIFLGTTMAPMASFASVEGKRNTAIGLTGVAVYAAIRGKKTAAIGLGAGAAYAWKRHSDARKDQAYGRGYNKGYHKGHYKKYHKRHCRC